MSGHPLELYMKRRDLLVTACTGLAVTTAGCSNEEGDGEPTDGDNETTDGEGTEEQPMLEDDAGQYLLSVDEIPGDWEENTERGPEMDPAGLVSARVKELSSPDGEEEVNLAVAVFESADHASQYLADQRAGYEDVRDEHVGDESFSFTGSFSAVEARTANVAVQVIGTVHISNIREIATAQTNALE